MKNINSILILSILVIAGCSGDKTKTGDKDKPDSHSEVAPHGGILFAAPKDVYHLELVTEKGKPAVLYAAGKDPTKNLVFYPEKTITMTTKGSSDVKIEFKPDPQPGDPQLGYSRFKATTDLPEKLDMKKVEFSGEIGGKTYIFTLDED